MQYLKKIIFHASCLIIILCKLMLNKAVSVYVKKNVTLRVFVSWFIITTFEINTYIFWSVVSCPLRMRTLPLRSWSLRPCNPGVFSLTRIQNKIVCPIISSRIDNFNAALYGRYGVSAQRINHLQPDQNFLAQVDCATRVQTSEHITSLTSSTFTALAAD